MKRRVRIRRPRKTITVTFAGDQWTVVFRRDIDGKVGHWGQTYWDKREIHLDPRIFNPKILDEYDEPVTTREIALHEGLHALMPWMGEPFIDRMAKDLDAYLDDLDV